MKDTQLIMGMPITIDIVKPARPSSIKECFNYFRSVDERYSPFKPASEVSLLNSGHSIDSLSEELAYVLDLCEASKAATNGYFDIKKPDGNIDPSGLVKGWAIQNAANNLLLEGCNNFYIEAGGDVQAVGTNADNQQWTLGIRNPFDTQKIVKVLKITNRGIATSGNYIRGDHIYNPHKPKATSHDIASMTVIGPNVYDADRYATAAYAMGESGISFIEGLKDFDGYMIDQDGLATYTSGFEAYVN